MEIWRKIEGYNSYEVSNLGRVRSLHFNKVLMRKQRTDKDGYLRLGLNKDKKQSVYLVHSLVAKAFCKQDNIKKNTVDHINRNRSDNRAVNLKWLTFKENTQNRMGRKGLKMCIDSIIEMYKEGKSKEEIYDNLGLNYEKG